MDQNIGALIEELLVGKDTKNVFEDLFIKSKYYDIHVNIKTSNFLNNSNSSPTWFNIKKLIKSYNKTYSKIEYLFFVFYSYI